MELKAKAGQFPASPGVYLMKDEGGRIIYVGKAVNLRARVKSYFREGADGRPQIPLLMERARDIEFIVTESEKEAFFLENSLIKRHHPRFNVDLRDDKTYYSLRLPVKDRFPRLTLVRKVKDDGALYFGPYSSARDLHDTIDLIHKVFPLRHCSEREFTSRKRPCLYQATRGCKAPCSGLISEEEYRHLVDEVVLFLNGKNKKLIQLLKNGMERAAIEERFEEAALLRDRIRAVETTLEKQKVVSHGGIDKDVVGWVREGSEAQAAILVIRSGLLIDRRGYYMKNLFEDDEETLAEFVRRYYGGERIIPAQILLGTGIGHEAEAIGEWLTEKRGKKVTILNPRRGEGVSLLRLADKNARELLDQRRKSKVGFETALEELRVRLSLPHPPRKIECYDISNIQGTAPVASMVAFLDGMPLKEGYRKFSIKSVAGQDDFAMMAEVIRRRFSRSEDGWEWPDLVVIDGGPGQLSAAKVAMEEAGAGQVPVIGLAKSRPIPGAEGVKTPERIFLPGRKNPLILSRNSSALFILQRIRDEAHRFAVEYHRKRRSTSTISSALDGISGVGVARRKALLKRFGSVAGILRASAEEIAGVEGIGKNLAETILKSLGEKQKGRP
ncbi:excinuclease ABC subunit UvrC [bacterium]|nr:MAG: excinuclease ABC subunit UvrC [bacterium]